MPVSQRFTALDVFRGMTVCFMIIVNTPGNGATSFSPLQHAKWHGFTPTDLVFPSFLFVVGNAMSFALKKWETMAQSKVLWKILKRTVLIFLLGYLMYWFPFVKWGEDSQIVPFPIDQTRIFGVLQRIAICYGIAALLFYYCKPKAAVIISIFFLLLYWVLLYWLGNAADPLSLHGNAVLRADQWLMADSHLYHGDGLAFDPEGFLSTLPAIANVTAGCIVGIFLQQKERSYETLTRLLLAGCALVAIGYFWNLLLPINKKLWTSSFVVYTVGLDCIILSGLIYLIDFRKKTKWNYFFEVFGRNPLFIYLLSELGAIILYFIRVAPGQSLFQWLYQTLFQPMGIYTGSFMFAICFMLLCWVVGWWLDKRKIYIRV